MFAGFVCAPGEQLKLKPIILISQICHKAIIPHSTQVTSQTKVRERLSVRAHIQLVVLTNTAAV